MKLSASSALHPLWLCHWPELYPLTQASYDCLLPCISAGRQHTCGSYVYPQTLPQVPPVEYRHHLLRNRVLDCKRLRAGTCGLGVTPCTSVPRTAELLIPKGRMERKGGCRGLLGGCEGLPSLEPLRKGETPSTHPLLQAEPPEPRRKRDLLDGEGRGLQILLLLGREAGKGLDSSVDSLPASHAPPRQLHHFNPLLVLLSIPGSLQGLPACLHWGVGLGRISWTPF